MRNSPISPEGPVYETLSFILRLVKMDDARSLLTCYADKRAVLKMNADHCTSDFYFTTIQEMESCIASGLKEYHEHKYMRLAVLPKGQKGAVGTVEIFSGESGILRIDIATKYDKERYIEELIRVAVHDFIRDFQIGNLKIKVSNTPERIPLLKKYGFVPSPSFYPEGGYYEKAGIKSTSFQAVE